MNDWVTVVTSKFDDIFEVFVSSFREATSGALIVVDDGLSDGIKKRFEHSLISYVPAPQPFGFSAAVNAGIEAAGRRDVIYLNDDCYIHTVGLDEKLNEVAYAEPSIALVTCLMTNVHNQEQVPGNAKVAARARLSGSVAYALLNDVVSFGCVYLPRWMIDLVGGMDEGYIMIRSDIDYCRTLWQRGYSLAICLNAFVEHGGPMFGRQISNTRFRVGGRLMEGCHENDRARFLEKWGSLP